MSTSTTSAGGGGRRHLGAMRWHLIGSYGLPDAAILDLTNGLTSADWQPLSAEQVPPLPEAAQSGFLFAMGRAEEHKGFDDLINTVLLRRQGVRVPHLLLAAVTDDPQPNSYQQHLARHLSDENFDATLWTRFSYSVRGLLAHPALAAVVIPSRVEPFGRVPLEAYVAGAAPVVATTAGGLAELVIDGRTGYTAPPSNPRALANALYRSLSSGGDRDTHRPAPCAPSAIDRMVAGAGRFGG